MDREFKSKVGWWYHLVILLMIAGCVKAFMGTQVAAMIGMLAGAMLILHIFFNTRYTITSDGFLIARCSIFPQKKISIADIEAVESTVMPVSSYALSLDRLMIWTHGKVWLLISPENKQEFVKQLKRINPNIKLK